MANTQAQFGFRPIGYSGGAAPDFQLMTASVQSSFATKIWFGDPVCYSAAAAPYIVPATGTGTLSAIIGIFQGCYFTPSSGALPQWSPWFPASTQTDATAYLAPNVPGAKFLAAALLTAIPATSIGFNIGFSTGAGGTTVGGGFSTFTVDATQTTSNAMVGAFRLLGLYQGIGNGSDPTTSFNWVVVGFNQLCTATLQ